MTEEPTVYKSLQFSVSEHLHKDPVFDCHLIVTKIQKISREITKTAATLADNFGLCIQFQAEAHKICF